MDWIFIFAQVLGFIIAFISFFTYIARKRSHILTVKLVTDVLSVFQQAMLGALTGSVLNVVAVFREIVFYNRDKHKWASGIWWLFLFIVLMGAAPLLTWTGWICLLPSAGSILAVIGFYIKNPTRTRIIGIFAQIFWLIYTIYTVNYGTILCNALLIVSAIIGLGIDLWQYLKKRRENRSHEKQ
ncbi:MAG: YgjV family protein [Candidatus Neoclostridium sp.]